MYTLPMGSEMLILQVIAIWTFDFDYCNSKYFSVFIEFACLVEQFGDGLQKMIFGKKSLSSKGSIHSISYMLPRSFVPMLFLNYFSSRDKIQHPTNEGKKSDWVIHWIHCYGLVRQIIIEFVALSLCGCSWFIACGSTVPRQIWLYIYFLIYRLFKILLQCPKSKQS